jgi:triacylglycerol esterase/lipase EstA (alpha/beta hydrolase family)
MKKAFERWEQDHAGEPLEEVNIVAHSTGGLIARTYIQSPAYNAVFTGTKKLPKVKNLIMVGVPNRGASKAWNALHDNWNADIAYKYVLSKSLTEHIKRSSPGGPSAGPTIT